MKAKVFRCANCGHIIEVPFGLPKPSSCPKCGSPASLIHRMNPGPPGVGRE
ncbi:MAG: zinc ribbon domain-containing protein [Methanomassiliicoccales archaeon]|nr:zinc ribbon domain-containing protein [Methanomassiliicoccales archaeon]